jgi:D-aminoacyl-tRNA deacylase
MMARSLRLKLVLQRVSQASVAVSSEIVGTIDQGFVVLIGVGQGDQVLTANRMIEKMLQLRVFADEQGKMNRSITDVGGSLLLISQFTLYADCRKGRRPAFTDAAPPVEAKMLYDYFVQRCRESNVHVQCGIFAADMQVSLVNDGPVTIVLDSKELAF